MIGTDFPYREWYPEGKTVIQIDARPEHLGRRTHVDARPGRARRRRRCARLLDAGRRQGDRPSTCDKSRERVRGMAQAAAIADRSRLRREPGRPHPREVRQHRRSGSVPRRLAQAIDRHAAQDAVFTTDTGMSTVWLSRFVTMTGPARAARLVQPRLDGQRHAAGARRAGARPRAPGRRVLRRRRAVDAARRPDDRGHLRPARQARRVRQRPARAW